MADRVCAWCGEPIPVDSGVDVTNVTDKTKAPFALHGDCFEMWRTSPPRRENGAPVRFYPEDDAGPLSADG